MRKLELPLGIDGKKITKKIKLNRRKVTLKKGKSFKLKVSLTPKNSQDKIIFKTSNKKIVKVSKTGKIKAARIPIFKFPLHIPDTIPTRLGPPEQPISPPKARSANKAVPPAGSAFDALEKVPGHMIPTDRPHRAHPARLKTRTGINTRHR